MFPSRSGQASSPASLRASTPASAPATASAVKAAEPEAPSALVQKVATGTLRWLAHIPVQSRPIQLTRKYPRIANKLAELWRDPAQCAFFIETLRVDRRGARQGFPPEVEKEIEALHRYFLAGCGK
jgi:hypothetical protein